jgi:hypothetical protein
MIDHISGAIRLIVLWQDMDRSALSGQSQVLAETGPSPDASNITLRFSPLLLLLRRREHLGRMTERADAYQNFR